MIAATCLLTWFGFKRSPIMDVTLTLCISLGMIREKCILGQPKEMCLPKETKSCDVPERRNGSRLKCLPLKRPTTLGLGQQIKAPLCNISNKAFSCLGVNMYWLQEGRLRTFNRLAPTDAKILSIATKKPRAASFVRHAIFSTDSTSCTKQP
jgi:hypothetical protein